MSKRAERQKTIIVVDDDEAVTRMIVSLLGSTSFRVFPTTNSREAFKVAHEHGAPDLVIVDVMMPDMDGRELGKWLKAGYRNIKLLFISGYELSLIDPTVLGPDAAFLKKPFQPAELRDAVRTILGPN